MLKNSSLFFHATSYTSSCCWWRVSSTSPLAHIVKRFLLLIPMILLVSLATWSLIGQATFLRDPTTPEDWKLAAQHITTDLVPRAPERTKILVWPVWRETPLPDLIDVSSLLLWNGAPLLEDLQRTSHLIVITPVGRIDEVLKVLPFTPDGALVRKDFETVSVLDIKLPEAMQWPSPSLVELLPKATVTLRAKDGTVTPCTSWNPRGEMPGWSCPGHPHVITASEFELDDQPRRCILAHPPSQPDVTLLITFPRPEDLPAASTLRVRAGFDLRGARLAGTNDDLWLKVRAGEQELATRTYKAQTSMWEALDIPVKGAGGLDAITLEISAQTSAHKLFCLDGWIIPQ